MPQQRSPEARARRNKRAVVAQRERRRRGPDLKPRRNPFAEVEVKPLTTDQIAGIAKREQEEQAERMRVYATHLVMCDCGQRTRGAFCAACGKSRGT
jgi:hypothetical protein